MLKLMATIPPSKAGLLGRTSPDTCLARALTYVREALEDLTGGVTSDVLTSNILDKDRFWKEELMHVNQEFLFGCGTGIFSNWLEPEYSGPPRDRKGICENHSYSIMEAREVDGQRLLRLRYE